MPLVWMSLGVPALAVDFKTKALANLSEGLFFGSQRTYNMSARSYCRPFGKPGALRRVFSFWDLSSMELYLNHGNIVFSKPVGSQGTDEIGSARFQTETLPLPINP